MFFRFCSAIVLVVLVSLVGTVIEKGNLVLRREVTRQHYRLNVMLEAHAKLRLKTQQMGAPIRVIETLENGKLELRHPLQPMTSDQRRMPLLQWQRANPLPL